MKRITLVFVLLVLFITIDCIALDTTFELTAKPYATASLGHLSKILSDLKPSEVSLCISFIKDSTMNSREIAETVFKWNPDKHRAKIASVFRKKITRLVEKLRTIDYGQLIVDIDFIKNSRLTTTQIIETLQSLRKQQG